MHKMNGMLLLNLLARLPLSLLYGLSDACAWFLIHVFSYRKTIILKNLRNSFPEKPEQEIQGLLHAFYHYFCDNFFEFIKGSRFTEKDALEKMDLVNFELAEDIVKAGKSVLLVAGHMGNWEWAIHRLGQTSITHDIVYQKLSSKTFNEYTAKTRNKFPNVFFIERKETMQKIKERKDMAKTLCLLADQAPNKIEYAYWTQFLHQETAFFTGMERIAKEYDLPILYGEITRAKRGKYQLRLEKLSTKAIADYAENELLECFAQRLEKTIRQYPEQYLWSHNRWKKQRPQS